MKARYVNEIAQGGRIDAPVVVRSKDVRVARNGDAYLSLELADRTGSIPAVLFRPSAEAVNLPAGAVAQASGSVTLFRGHRRISLESLTPAASWNPEDLVASSPSPTGELVEELRACVRLVKQAPLGRLLRAAFGDRELFERFCRCPATRDEHHAYLGGVLEHTVAVTKAAAAAADAHAGVDRDLLITAALLHDIGRVDELTWDTSIGLTDVGRLLGHGVLGAHRVRDLCSRAGVDALLAAQVEHVILAHHGGEGADGAEVRPATLEALIVRNADILDRQAACFASVVAGAGVLEERWTGSDNAFGRALYSGALGASPASDTRAPRARRSA